MLSDVKIATVIIAIVTAATVPTVAHSDERSGEPNAASTSSPLSPDPNGTLDTVTAGERLSLGEKDARIGWLIETYVTDARAALGNNRIHEATETLALAQSALRTLEDKSAGKIQNSSLFSILATSFARAEEALSAGDRAGADRVLADSERRWRAALIDLDTVMLPQSGTAGDER
jgi:hypothetical protein